MSRLVRGASLLFTGLFTGFLLWCWCSRTRLRGFDASVYTQVRLVELDSLDTLASVTLIPAIVTTVVLAIWARGNDRRLVLVAIALLVVVFATTLAINLPINSDQSSWSVQNPPADWADVRDRWQVATGSHGRGTAGLRHADRVRAHAPNAHEPPHPAERRTRHQSLDLVNPPTISRRRRWLVGAQGAASAEDAGRVSGRR